jgi:hypothetical protein
MLNCCSTNSHCTGERETVEELGKLLPAIWKRHAQRANPHLADILASLWPQVVGKPLAQHCRPVGLEGGRLTLGTADADWAVQLRFMSEEIRAEINSFLGSPAVKKLFVKHVPGLKLAAALHQNDTAPVIPANRPPLDAGGAKLDREVARILAQSYAKYFARPGKMPNR